MLRIFLHLVLGAAFAPLCLSQQLTQQQTIQPIPGPNVNMVSGTQWPTGDPFLQRQNEPSMAISSRNPLHILAGANDYRTVDIPFSLTKPDEPDPSGDAWLGLFESFDGGKTWASNLVPGYPQDSSSEGMHSPLKAFTTGADPAVRAGTNGMFYYAGLGFNRVQTTNSGQSNIFVARFVDYNNVETNNVQDIIQGGPIHYLGTTLVLPMESPAARTKTTNTPGKTIYFEDKPSLAVDIPRPGAGKCRVPDANGGGSSQTFAAGNIYVAWTEFTGGEHSNVTTIRLATSSDCGVSFQFAHSQQWPDQVGLSDPNVETNQGATIAIDPNSGNVYVAWRVFASHRQEHDTIVYVVSTDGGKTFTAPALVAIVDPFEQGTTDVSFRTNAYPAMAIDNYSRVYVAWSQRGADPATPAARIVFVTGTPLSSGCEESAGGLPTVASTASMQWSSPVQVSPNDDPLTKLAHQFMPALAFSSGKLTAAWYDQRLDDRILVYTGEGSGKYSNKLMAVGGGPVFGEFIEDIFPPNTRRHTIDVWAAQLTPTCSGSPSFGLSAEISSYDYGSLPTSVSSFPNADSPYVIQQLFVNPPNLPIFSMGSEPFFGDYIDIAGPTFLPNHDGTWRYNNQTNDPDFTHIVWTDNRNVVAPPDDDWPMYVPPTYDFLHPQSLFLSTATQPSTENRQTCTVGLPQYTGDRNQDIYTAALGPGLSAHAPTNFKQLGIVAGKEIERQFPIVVENTTANTNTYQLTIISQSPGVSAHFANTQPLTIPPLSSAANSLFVSSSDPHGEVQIGVQQIGGQNEQTTVTINGDISNPDVSNIANLEIYNPNISNPNISNPNISNPNISNPNISNPNISNILVANPNISNPNISNPNISNPNISNGAVANPNISNPNISNPNISNGPPGGGELTDGSYTVTNVGNTASSYMINLNKNSTKVVSQVIVSRYYTTPVAQGCNLTVESHFIPLSNVVNPNSGSTPTIALLPGELALITVRAFDKAITQDTPENRMKALADYNPLSGLKSVASQAPNTPPAFPPDNLLYHMPSPIKITTSPLVLQLGTDIYNGTISIMSTQTFTGPLYLVLSQLPENVTASNPDGTSATGEPFYVIQSINAGQTVTRNISFMDSSNTPIKFVPKVFLTTP